MARFLNNENQFAIPNYLGGIHEEVDSILLKSNEAAKAQNCDIGKGVLKASKGLLNVYSLTAPKALMTYYSAGNNNLMAIANGILYKWSGNAWIQVATGLDTSADRYDFINDNIDDKDIIVFSNGIDPVKYYDGTTFRNLKRLGKVSAEASDNIMNGKYLIMHYERLWIADDNNLYASSVTRSQGFDIEDFTTPTEELEYNQHGFDLSMYGADGKIVGLSVCFDDILIWKEKSIHKIFGTDPNNYQKISFSAKGGISDKSIGIHETGAYFIDHNGINYYDGTNVHYISKPIEDTWKALDTSKLGRAVGFISGNKYIVAVCESGTSNNLIIEYDIQSKNFMLKRGFSVEGAVEFSRKNYVITGGNDIYEYGTGTALSAYWESGYTDLGVPEASKEIDTIYCIATGTGSLKITVTSDKTSKEMIIPLSPDGKVYCLNTMITGKMFRVRIENVSNADFTLRGFKILYELDYD